MDSKKMQSIFITALRGCRHLRVINRSTESPMFAVFDFASFEVSPDRRRRDTREEGMNEGGQSWYAGPETAAALISATRRVRCTLRMADRIIDRWMDGWERGKGLVQHPCPLVSRGSLSLFLPPGTPSLPFRCPLPILSHSSSLVEVIALFLSPIFRYLLLRAPQFSLFN